MIKELREKINLLIEIRRDYNIDLPESPLIIDCGAYIGLSALYFKKKYPNAKIHAFEPNPHNFKKLLKNTKNKEGIFCYQIALGLKEGQVKITDQESGSTISREGIETASIKLSNFIKTQTDLIKIDVEGSEWDVMKDLNFSGAIKKVDNFIIEVHHHNKRDLIEILSILKENCFNFWIKSSPPINQSQSIIIKATRE